jgi:hypothetical protein
MFPARPLTRRTGRDERMVAMSASVSGLNPRCWLQVWNASGVILMSIFPLIVPKSRSLSLLKKSIPEIRQKCDRFQTFLGVSPIYLGAELWYLTKKGVGKRKKRGLRCHATLCERIDSLRALDSVGGYMENGHFHLINDIFPGVSFPYRVSLQQETQTQVAGGECMETSSLKTLRRWGIQTGKPSCQPRNRFLH